MDVFLFTIYDCCRQTKYFKMCKINFISKIYIYIIDNRKDIKSSHLQLFELRDIMNNYQKLQKKTYIYILVDVVV